MTAAHRSRIGLVSVILLMPCLVAKAGESLLDLSGRSLAHSDYSGRNLRGANLRKADLTMADFSRADLRGADLTGSKLDRAKLDDADLRGVIGWAKADLGLGLSAVRANFAGTDLRNAKVAGGDSGGYFDDADFTQADLTGATLDGWFHGARFDGATLRGALMLGAGGVESIRGDLRKRGAIAVGEDFAVAVTSGRDFSNSLLQGTQLQDLNLTAAKLQGADLHSANFDRTVLDGADLRGADLRGAELYWASAMRARFDGANLADTHLDNMRADDASFVGAKLVHASLLGTHLCRANLRNVDLTGANLSYADLTGADLTGAILDDVKVEAAIFNDVRGLSPETYRDLRNRAGRWRHDLDMAIGDFLRTWSFPLHLMLTPLGVVLGIGGRQTTGARRSFTVLTGVNAAALLPLFMGLGMGLSGGSPVAQMSVSNMGLWHTWFHAWPVLMFVMHALLLGSLICGGFHIVRYVLMPPRHKARLSSCCVLVTVANCFFAAQVLLLMAPDA